MPKIKTEDDNKRGNPIGFPLLPLRDIVVFPHMVVPLFVGREKSIRALQAAMDCNRLVLLAAQKNAKTDDPREDEIHVQGTLCRIVQLLNLPDRTVCSPWTLRGDCFLYAQGAAGTDTILHP